MLAIVGACWTVRGEASEQPAGPSEAKPSERASAGVPRSVVDLLAIEQKVAKVFEKISPATVAVRIGKAQGSGVIVTKDGYVLTAAHVAGKPGVPVAVMFSDGREAKGITLGVERTVDAGMIKITDPGEWPFVPMADSTLPELGTWTVAIGHPNGFQKDRGAVPRLGRIITARKGTLQTDCTLVGGDSGGPLCDLDGNVIGIHSRIGVSTTWNFHVPMSQFRTYWDRLARSEDIERGSEPGTAVLGITGDEDQSVCRVVRVADGLPAQEAGIKPGDVISKFNGETIKNFADLAVQVKKRKPGDEVAIELQRDGKSLELKVTLASRE